MPPGRGSTMSHMTLPHPSAACLSADETELSPACSMCDTCASHELAAGEDQEDSAGVGHAYEQEHAEEVARLRDMPRHEHAEEVARLRKQHAEQVAGFEEEIRSLKAQLSAREKEPHAARARTSTRDDTLEELSATLRRHSIADEEEEDGTDASSDDTLSSKENFAAIDSQENTDGYLETDMLEDTVDDLMSVDEDKSLAELLLPNYKEEKPLNAEEAEDAVHELVTFFFHELVDLAAGQWNWDGREPRVPRSAKCRLKWHDYLALKRDKWTAETAEAFDRVIDEVCVRDFAFSVEEKERLLRFLQEGSEVNEHSYSRRQTRDCIELLQSVTEEDKKLLYALVNEVVTR